MPAQLSLSHLLSEGLQPLPLEGQCAGSTVQHVVFPCRATLTSLPQDVVEKIVNNLRGNDKVRALSVPVP